MDLILCTQKNTRLDILDPKNTWLLYTKNAILRTVYVLPYCWNSALRLHADYSNHAFGSCGNFGLNCVRTISLAEIRTQKNTRLNLQLQKIQELKILDPKKYVGPRRHVYTRVTYLGCEPDYENEAKCKAFHMKTSFICTWMETTFHIKDFALRLAFIMRFKATRKWPILEEGKSCRGFCMKQQQSWKTLARITLITVAKDTHQ